MNSIRYSGAFVLVLGLFGAAFAGAMPTAAQTASGATYVIRFDHWTDADERDFGEFLAGIGRSGCTTVNACLHDPSNPFQASDPPNVYFRSDCANLPYVLRAYFAWKRGLPFSYESGVAPLGGAADDRYSPNGNRVTARTDVLTGSTTGYALLNKLLAVTSSASYRIGPHADTPPLPDFYSAAIDAKAIHPGTVIYDPNGHLALVFNVERDGRIEYIDSHPDNTLTRGYYDLRFVRSNPGAGAGFKNWRPLHLVGYSRGPDGALVGGHIELARNEEIPDYSDEQYYGNGTRVADADWANGTFLLNGETLDYYDYVRAKVGGGKLQFDPVKEIAEQLDSNCADLHYRAQAVDIAIAAGIQNRPEPGRLPRNIYGTNGDWETYSTPSRDARLKTAFKELRDKAQRFVGMYENGDTKHLLYTGRDLVDDMLAAYDQEAGKCSVTYRRSNGAPVTLSYEDARKRLFLISFDPYHCVERRWGATDAEELSSCRDGEVKRAWYEAEQNLRNQIDRTYDARMDFTLADLQTPGPGKGVPQPPDTDARGYLLSLRGQVTPRAPTVAAAEPPPSPAELVGVASSKPDFDLRSWQRQRDDQYAAWERSRGGLRSAGPYYGDPPHSDGANAAIWDAPDAPEMMVIPAGTFVMGSPPDERGRKAAEGPQHRVRIGRSFAISRDLITFDEWNACAAEGGCQNYFPRDERWGRGTRPVINVSWNDAHDYIAWLNAKTGRHYRLPTEAEWEYAARAGTTTPYYTGYTLSTAQANYDGADYPRDGSPGVYRQMTTPVGTFSPNGFGLTDMGGNVWEWTEDCWNADYRGAPSDGSAWLRGDCNRRVVRAGAFNNTPAFARSAFRFWEVGQLRSAFIGFRVARDL
ncbi:MAG TPA: formylglycine-generating enzyme family protein [Rhizomicrobium sp.]|jgi:formylglycine-generating enzyme required for sulfatase activity|nr:formylglycine-generating enzyme family protein [Rhizomicrobium sp.]